jgi:hypothetical protein
LAQNLVVNALNGLRSSDPIRAAEMAFERAAEAAARAALQAEEEEEEEEERPILPYSSFFILSSTNP